MQIRTGFRAWTTHVCVERRHMEASATGPRLGLQVFVRFYQITAISKKTKTLDEFVESQFYIDFVRSLGIT